MDCVLRIAALLTALCAPQDSLAAATGAVPTDFSSPSVAARIDVSRAGDLQVDSWTGEDKLRHAAASWASMVFIYAAARAVQDDHDTAIAVALPVTASFGIAKEFVDRRRGGPFSFRDLAADALGAGAAWLFLREVR